ncbi:MAG: hypothetical protein MJE66_25160 [Proteobacteria bacterium]|nr:hypothetical protein [Pseudomonadota bacterium]
MSEGRHRGSEGFDRVVGLVAGLCVVALASAAPAEQSPPRNPYLADSIYALGHGDSAQQDSVSATGPVGESRTLRPDEIDYAPLGPAHFGATISGPYPDGRRVVWSNGLDRIVKLDHATWEVLATFWLPGTERYGEARAEASIARWDDRNTGFGAIVQGFLEARKLRDLSGVYTLLDRDGIYYIAGVDGSVTAYADATPGDPSSAIEVQRRARLPTEVTGHAVGMNMTYDGWLVVATEHGWLVALSRDLSRIRTVRLHHSQGAEDKATREVGYGWVRNGFAVDAAGGIYLVSQDHLHKVVWTGDRLSVDTGDGAFTARYRNGWGHGSGATPSLMGFGDEDRFVVITDGDPVMNVTLFWRDAIPDDWRRLPNAPDRRIAGMLPATMGIPPLPAIQSEQSVVVSGYGALVVNNVPRNVPWWVPRQAEPLFSSYLGSSPEHQPFGVQKFVWDPEARRFQEAWVNREISSPSCVPIVSRENGRVYLIGARQNRWTLEAIDWRTGVSDFHWIIGGQRFNPIFSGTLLDQSGRIHFGTLWGRARIDPSPPANWEISHGQ